MIPHHNKIPSFLLDFPKRLSAVNFPASAVDLAKATTLASNFLTNSASPSNPIEIIRAMRLAKNTKCYIGVGTWDKSVLAWAMTMVAPDAKIIDINITQDSIAIEKLRDLTSKDITYHAISGEPTSWETVSATHEFLNGALADIIFLNSAQSYSSCAAEFSLYWQFLKKGGVIMINDAFWEGNEAEKGKAHTIDRIDRYMPVYLLSGNNPVTRYFFHPLSRGNWGGIGIIIKQELSESSNYGNPFHS